jgi:hypothetical protein
MRNFAFIEMMSFSSDLSTSTLNEFALFYGFVGSARTNDTDLHVCKRALHSA